MSCLIGCFLGYFCERALSIQTPRRKVMMNKFGFRNFALRNLFLLVAFVAVFLAGRKSFEEFPDISNLNTRLIPIYVVHRDISANTRLTKNDFKVERWPADKVPLNAIRIRDAKGTCRSQAKHGNVSRRAFGQAQVGFEVDCFTACPITSIAFGYGIGLVPGRTLCLAAACSSKVAKRCQFLSMVSLKTTMCVLANIGFAKSRSRFRRPLRRLAYAHHDEIESVSASVP